MSSAIEIPLAADTALGLSRRGSRPGHLVAAAALLAGGETGARIDSGAADATGHQPSLPIALDDSVVRSAHGANAPQGSEGSRQAIGTSGGLSPAPADAGPEGNTHAVSTSSEDRSRAHAGREPVTQPSVDRPLPDRAGDVYIAHYYARLPGDVNQNPYTRLGGATPYG